MKTFRCFACMREYPEGEQVCTCGNRHGYENQPTHALRCGTILNGKYLVGKVIGQGGFGITYVGWDLLLQRKVAIKEYFPAAVGGISRNPRTNQVLWTVGGNASVSQKEGYTTFLKEARKMAKLEEIPGIVGVKDIFEQFSTAYIVMNFVDGVTLASRLQKNGTIPYDTLIDLLVPVLRALGSAHSHGIIHRDISPDNIMLDHTGTPWILDMGAAKDLTPSGTPSPTSQLVVKHGFSPPEQYMFGGNIGPWTDVYALCATIYYCVVGKVPEIGSSPLQGYGRLTPMQLQVLQLGMAFQPENRMQSMDALYNALRAAKSGGAAVPPTPRNVSGSPGSADAQIPPAMPVQKKSPLPWIIAAAAAALLVAAGGIGLAIGLGGGKAPAPSVQASGSQSVPGQSLLPGSPDKEPEEAVPAETEPNPFSGPKRPIAVDGGDAYTVVLYGDGTCAAVGSKESGCSAVSSWTEIVQISAGSKHTVGLRRDGTVVATGRNTDGQCNVEGWTDIVQVSAGLYHTVGLKKDGTVVAVGSNATNMCEVSGWHNVQAVGAAQQNTVVLLDDGTMEIRGAFTNGGPALRINGMSYIEVMSIGSGQFVGLHHNGTVVAKGNNDSTQCDVDAWENIKGISAGTRFTVGLDANGRVWYTGLDNSSLKAVTGWQNVAYIGTGVEHIVGILENGTIVAVGENIAGECDVAALNQY